MRFSLLLLCIALLLITDGGAAKTPKRKTTKRKKQKTTAASASASAASSAPIKTPPSPPPPPEVMERQKRDEVATTAVVPCSDLAFKNDAGCTCSDGAVAIHVNIGSKSDGYLCPEEDVSKEKPPLPPLPAKPNLIVIAVDNLRASMLGIYGNTSMQQYTPNINALAKESVVFDAAYAAAGSTPSRASFLTARHAVRSGMVSGSRFGLSFFSPAQPGGLSAKEKTLPEMLKTDPAYGPMGHFGTWHLGYGGPRGAGLPLQHGYDRFFGTLMQPSLKSCDNNLGTQATVAEDKYGNTLDASTPEAQAAAAAAKAEAKAGQHDATT